MSMHEEEVLRWRENRVARLTGSDGWLTVVVLALRRQGADSVGSNPESRVQRPGGPGRVGSITVAGGTITATFEPEVGVTHDGEPVIALNLRDDSQGDPALLRLGSLSFYVIRRADRLAVRVKDSASPARRSFTGIEYYPLDPRWRFRARFERYDPPGTSRVPTVVGREETYQVPGALVFEHQGVTYGIDAFLEEGETDLFIIFGDLTNGSETYGGGRYLYAPQPA